MKKLFQNLMFAIILVAASTAVHAQTSLYSWDLVGNANAGTTSKLGTTTNVPLYIYTNNAKRITVKSNGQVGIGTTTVSTGFKLEVAGDSKINGVTAGLGGGAVSTNAVFGPLALGLNTTGYYNTANGAYALNQNTTGYRLTASGFQSLSFNTTGYYNSGYGVNSLRFNTTGSFNTAIGDNSMVTGTTSYANTALGQSSMYYITTGQYNTASGYGVLENITTGSNNAVFGSQAFLTNTTGSNNTGIGYGADATSNNLVDASAIGYNAKVCSSYMMVLGDTAVTKWGFGTCPGSANILAFSHTTARLTTGGTWTNASDRRLKNNFEDLDNQSVLDKINHLNIQRWHYIADQEPVTHIGPIAQDFYAAFKVGDDTTISTIDPSGVALIGIQQLSKKNDELKGQVDNLRTGNEELANQVNELTSLVNELKGQVQSLDVSLSQCCASYQQSKTNSLNSLDNTNAHLFEIAPNPFSQKSTITFTLPSDASNAQLLITDASGKVLKTYALSSGSTEQVINANKFSAGVYQYSLVVNGKTIDSKQMVIAK